jgi:hypothetical protein
LGLIDVTGFGEEPKQEEFKISENAFKPNDFEDALVEKQSGLVKYEAINRKFNLGKLLMGLGYTISSQNMYCPFHADEITGKPSAKYHADTDILYCFSENKCYTAYHALKILYAKDMDKIFDIVWTSMSSAERQEILDKVEPDKNHIVTKESQSEWEQYKTLLLNFRDKNVNYTQFKNGLYKALDALAVEGVDSNVSS